MKNFLQILILFFSVTIFGQQSTINEKIGYQAVVRNTQNQLVQNQNIKVKASLMIGASGEPFYIEIHNTQTNNNGLFNIQIGGGNSELGNYYNSIFWAGANIFLKTEIDPLGGSNYTISSTTEFLSVPYANSAKVAWSLVGASNNFVGFWKEIVPTGQVGGHIAISYISPNQFLCHIIDRYAEPGVEEDWTNLAFGNVTNGTLSGGWEATLLDMEESFGDDFYLQAVLNGNELKIITDNGDEGVTTQYFTRIQ